MAVAYQDTSVPGAPTLIVGGTVGSQAPVSVATNDNVILSTNDDNIALIVTGGGTDALGSLGKNDSLWTNGAAHMTFVNMGQNTSDNIVADLKNFNDTVINFKAGDHLFVLGFGQIPTPPLPFPPGVNEVSTGAISSQLQIDFAGGAAYTAFVNFQGVSLPQLQRTHHVSTGTINGTPFLEVT